mgnify:CR=1 FL=1
MHYFTKTALLIVQNVYFRIMKITHFKNIDSTNSYLQNLLDKGEDVADNVVVTDFQTSGKGQGKNVWQSEDGKNLLFSIALDMSFLKAEDQFLLTQMVSVAMINVLKNYLPEENLFIKWPNDIYYKDKKIAGILIKNEIKGMMLGTSIIGIGLNVNQTTFDENLPNPISMKMITGKDYDLEELLSAISCQLSAISHQPSAVSNYVNRQQTTDNRPCITFNSQYTSYLYRYKQWAFYEHEGDVKEMMIIGYDQFGRLILKEKNDREVVCDLKEISFKV